MNFPAILMYPQPRYSRHSNISSFRLARDSKKEKAHPPDRAVASRSERRYEEWSVRCIRTYDRCVRSRYRWVPAVLVRIIRLARSWQVVERAGGKETIRITAALWFRYVSLSRFACVNRAWTFVDGFRRRYRRFIGRNQILPPSLSLISRLRGETRRDTRFLRLTAHIFAVKRRQRNWSSQYRISLVSPRTLFTGRYR